MSTERLGRVRATLATRAATRGASSSTADVAAPTPAEVAAALSPAERLLGSAAAREMVDELHRELAGAGPLEPLLARPEVTDVLVHGPREVLIDRGNGLEQVDVEFPDDQAVRRLAQRLAVTAGRRLDDATPFVDARLPSGVRLHAVLAPVSTKGTAISLRIPRRRARDLGDLVPPAVAELLVAIVRSRLAFLVTGAAGAGKTTLLGAMLSVVRPTERIVIVEDCAELAVAHPHVVQLEARPPNLEGRGGIDLPTLVRQALRMRPDRLVVGESRGPEMLDLLAAANTGHAGSCGTLHANTPADVPARVEALAASRGLDRASVHSSLAAALEVVIHARRDADGARRVAEIGVVQRHTDGLVEVVPALSVGRDGSFGEAPGAGSLRRLLRCSDPGAVAEERPALDTATGEGLDLAAVAGEGPGLDGGVTSGGERCPD